MTIRILLALGLVSMFLIAFGATASSAAGKPNPAVTVSPNTSLLDGQAVQVSGSGYQQQQIEIAECGGADLSAHPAVGPVCTYFTHSVTTQASADGSFGPTTFTVERVIVGTRYVNGNHPVSTTYDCSTANDCYIRAFSTTRGNRSATQTVNFAP